MEKDIKGFMLHFEGGYNLEIEIYRPALGSMNRVISFGCRYTGFALAFEGGHHLEIDLKRFMLHFEGSYNLEIEIYRPAFGSVNGVMSLGYRCKGLALAAWRGTSSLARKCST